MGIRELKSETKLFEIVKVNLSCFPSTCCHVCAPHDQLGSPSQRLHSTYV